MKNPRATAYPFDRERAGAPAWLRDVANSGRRLLMAASVAAMSCVAHAAQPAAIHVHSARGEPLEADIDLPAVSDLATLQARIAPPEAYRASNFSYDPALAAATLSLRRGADGRVSLSVRTRAALRTGPVELLIELTSSRDNVALHYTLQGERQTAAAPAVEREAASSMSAAQPAERRTSIVAATSSQAAETAAPTVALEPQTAEPATPPLGAQAVPTEVAPRAGAAAADAPRPPGPSAAAAALPTPPFSGIAGPAAPAAPREFLPELRDALPGPARAVPAAPRPRAGERPPPGRLRMLAVPKTAVRPTLDGALDDEAWKNAVVTDQFWISEQQRWPSEQTEVLVMADGEYLYFGFRVYDHQPQTVQALQTVRGAGLGLDDQVGVELDPFSSYREISTYSVNANGVQDDAIAGGRARQLAWKGDWQAAAIRTSYGWSAEIAIPFSILNFESGNTSLAVNFLRYHHRTAEWSRWADITLRALPEEMGRLTGVVFPQNGRTQPFTLMPYALVGHNTPDKRGRFHETLFNAGAELRYQPRPNLTGVLSINPDFSQIESAITNINFNYNEKFRADPRPFFQEGSAYFGDSRQYFYSNRVPDFDYGAKFFTRMQGYQVGALATRSPDDRTDIVFRGVRELDATHSVGAMVVATDRVDLKNTLYVLNAKGREASGLNYAFDVAKTSTDRQSGDGMRAAGSVGWSRDYWSLGVAADRYSLHYRPVNALLDRDLLDTSGVSPFVSYYRDLGGEAALREVRGDFSYTQRWTDDGRVQRQTLYTGGSIETQQQIRVGLWYTDGIYRPVGATPGSWFSTTNHDYYWTGSIDFNTRSSRFGLGGSSSSGALGGGDYRYTNVYAWARPTTTTFVNATGEKLENFGDFYQMIVAAGWDITPRHSVVGRYIRADYGSATRFAYTFHARNNVDFFVVYDRNPNELARLSAKVVMTFQ